jgi:DNA-binding response OmpR family regulator
MRLLVLTNDDKLLGALKECLKKQFLIDVEKEGASGVYASQCDIYSLILIDYELDDMSGRKTCSLIRKKGVKLPILMLNKGTKTPSVVSSLRNGADDCMDRDFNPEVLKARVNALLRRFSPTIPKDNVFRVKDVCIDFWKGVITKNGKKVKITGKEFKLFRLFFENKNYTLSRDRIVEALWKADSISSCNIVDVYVCNLRKSLRKILDVELIHTVHGIGYVFDDSELRKSE